MIFEFARGWISSLQVVLHSTSSMRLVCSQASYVQVIRSYTNNISQTFLVFFHLFAFSCLKAWLLLFHCLVRPRYWFRLSGFLANVWFCPKIGTLLCTSSFPIQKEFLLVWYFQLVKKPECRNILILLTSNFTRVTSSQAWDNTISVWYRMHHGFLRSAEVCHIHFFFSLVSSLLLELAVLGCFCSGWAGSSAVWTSKKWSRPRHKGNAWDFNRCVPQQI